MVSVKFSLWLIKYHAMKTRGGAEPQLTEWINQPTNQPTNRI
jgi:hypothetical protein